MSKWRLWRLAVVTTYLIVGSHVAPAAPQPARAEVFRVPEGAELRATVDKRTTKTTVDHHPSALQAVAPDGQVIDKIVPGRPFRIEARFRVDRPAERLEATVQGLLVAPGRAFNPLPLSRSEDPKLFRSGLLTIRPQPGAEDRLGFRRTQPGYDTEKSARIAADRFAGLWRVVQVGEGGPGGSGTATIAADGTKATLTLTAEGRERRYRSREIDAAAFADSYEADPDPEHPVRGGEHRAGGAGG
jgi:hypothetical protein